MSRLQKIQDQLLKLRLKHIPFAESAVSMKKQLHEVFTGRNAELDMVLPLFLNPNTSPNVMICGWWGIGKTAFIYELLSELREQPKTLTAYINLATDYDLATAAFFALASAQADQKYVQHLLAQLGIPIDSTFPKDEVGINTPIISFKRGQERIMPEEPHIYSLSFISLLEQTFKHYDKVVIAIDDLDKQDPSRFRELLLKDQALLKSEAHFIMTGYPTSQMRDLDLNSLGIYDRPIELEALSADTMIEMLVNYLQSARPDPDTKYALDDPRAVFPFTLETARELCRRTQGVPRWLNRMGIAILQHALQGGHAEITPAVLEAGIIEADRLVRTQDLSPQHLFILQLALRDGLLSEENIAFEDLQRQGFKSFHEILPLIQDLIQQDLLRRLPSDKAEAFGPTPLILPRTVDPNSPIPDELTYTQEDGQ